MIQITDNTKCVGCAACEQVCPVSCIKMRTDIEGFLYPVADADRCIQCDKCHKVCPVEHANTMHCDESIKILGANHKNDQIRLKGSSGSVFFELAQYCIAQNGVVWGAAYISSDQVAHICIDSINDLARLQKSKYVQSDLGNTFSLLKEQLKNRQWVLFSGTPCQIKALNLFLKTIPDHLILAEVVCHGVPSPLIFKKYMQEMDAEAIDFRKKENGWTNYDIEIKKKDGSVIRENASDNLYMKGFLKDLFTRPSCSACPAKIKQSVADFTIGDFWGVNTFIPDLYDNMGTSLLFLHTVKANKIWNEISNKFDVRTVEWKQAVTYNPCIEKSVALNSKRQSFFTALTKQSLLTLLNRYAKQSFSIKNTVKSSLLYCWNISYNLFDKSRDHFYFMADALYAKQNNSPNIMSLSDTLQYLITHQCSVSRFGDGEMKFIFGTETWFQKKSPELQQKLKDVLQSSIPNHLVCLPPVFDSLRIYKENDVNHWRKYMALNRKKWYPLLDKNKIYGDAFISRCYMPYQDKSAVTSYFDLWKQIWHNRDLLIVEGEKTRLGIGNDLFSNVKSIQRILCPNREAFSYYDQIINKILQFPKNKLILLAIGPTATILAADLAKSGYQAIDIGHIDIEYEWYRMQATHKVPVSNKFVNEAGAGKDVGDIDDEQYKKEIVCHFSV